MSELVILGLPPSSYVRTALMVCENKGVNVRLQMVNFRDPDYRQHHPFARMPVLQHGDVTLYEALAIAVYIDEAFEGPSLQPTTPVDRARMMQWISVINEYVYESVVRSCVSERVIKPMRSLAPDEAVIEAALPEIVRCLDVLADALAEGPYLCGEQLTLADLFLAPIMAYFSITPEGRTMLPDRPALGAWMSRMEDTPNYFKVNFMSTD
ncbi:glutathione S-transferase family protein [Flavimaricola marinus]|uniref:glutathione transferase n=1 Tax=Flavimaricola marinus TaxID=1819565 RepID=A0A238LII3_9RHOB|nr:glutathione S-transferase family protein [Flavimaricola marinus]SMY08680.1 hypothetical protein LOM8899_02835 [Flavimaricola marinus]